jgi:DNA-binding XRE family transcriptional regulator
MMSDPIDVSVLKIATATYRQAQSDLVLARDQLAAAVNEAIDAGMSQSEVARVVGVDRLTIRKWIA